MKKISFSSLLLALAVLFLATPSAAKVRAQCECRHAKSKEAFNLTVDFVSGGELTKATGDNRFNPTGAYAIAWIGGKSHVILTFKGKFFSNPVRENEVSLKGYEGADLRGLIWEVTPLDFSDEMQEGNALESLREKKK